MEINKGDTVKYIDSLRGPAPDYKPTKVEKFGIWDGEKVILDDVECTTVRKLAWLTKVPETKNGFKEGDWAAYNWLDDDGNTNWKIGRVVTTENNGLMYLNDDGTNRCGYMPLGPGVIKLENK